MELVLRPSVQMGDCCFDVDPDCWIFFRSAVYKIDGFQPNLRNRAK